MNMRTQEIDHIEQKAEGVLITTFGSVEGTDLPVRIGEVARRAGLSLKQADFKHPDVSGAYDRNNKEIIVDKDDDTTRQAFTIAHELGHHFLHEDKADEVYLRYFADQLSFEQKEMERQANRFAASLLMPRQVVLAEWQKTQDEKLLANKFGVSQSAMHYRLMNLGLISDEIHA